MNISALDMNLTQHKGRKTITSNMFTSLKTANMFEYMGIIIMINFYFNTAGVRLELISLIVYIYV